MASRKEAKSKAQMRKDKMKCNKPQRAPKGASQKYIVNACAKGDEKIVRFGYRGMQDSCSIKILSVEQVLKLVINVQRRKIN